MPNTYTQVYIQIVFAVEGRQNLIRPENREELHKYISGIVEKRVQKLIAIFCMPDHIHLLIGIGPSISLSDLVRDIKAGVIKFHKWKAMGPWPFQLAKRVQGIFLFAQSDTGSESIHRGAGEAP